MRMGRGRARIRVGQKVGYMRILRYFIWIFLVADIRYTGDKWAYSFDVVHDMLGLIEVRGGAIQFVKSLDEHFDGGHNDHTNEVGRIFTLRVGTC